MSGLQDVEWGECALEPRRDPEIERYLRRELGFVPLVSHYTTSCPWVARSVVIHQYNALLVHTDFRLADLVGIVVSQEGSCRFCYGAQRALLRIQGVSEERIRQLEGDLLDAELDPRERAALDFAKRLARASPLPGRADLEALSRLGFAPAEVRELAFVAASWVYFNRLSTLPALPPERTERLADHWLVRLATPVLGRLLRSRMRPGRREPLSPEARSGPYGSLVAALDALPAARALRRLLDEAFASPVLSVRAKALVFAVVARGLGCAASEAEASRIAREQGLSEPELDTVLRHLASPVLQPVEAAIVPVARDTIRYRPVEVQRRARGLLDRLSPDEFVEFIGISSLANAVCRLLAVLEARA